VGQLLLLVAVFVAFSGAHLLRNLKSPLHQYGEDEFPQMEEIWSTGAGETKVVNIPIQGGIFLGDGEEGLIPSSGNPTAAALRAIRRATLDSDVKGIILTIDSGGGGITASDILYEALLQFKDQDPERRIVAVFGDVAASGAYYIAMAADYIIAHPTTITGSIGVLLQTLNFKTLGDKIGVRDVTIKSGLNKDMLNPLQDVSPEHTNLLQDVVDQLHTRFVNLVAEGRDMPESEVRAIADGRIFSADDALKLKLVDELGYWQDAQDKLAELLNVESVKVYRYEEAFSLSSLFQAAAALPRTARAALESHPRLLYQWQAP